MHSPPAIMAKVIGRDTSSEAVSREVQRRAMDPDVADYEMDQVQPGSARSPITGCTSFRRRTIPIPIPEAAKWSASICRSRPSSSAAGQAKAAARGTCTECRIQP